MKKHIRLLHKNLRNPGQKLQGSLYNPVLKYDRYRLYVSSIHYCIRMRRDIYNPIRRIIKKQL
jgi:hypothetical protein